MKRLAMMTLLLFCLSAPAAEAFVVPTVDEPTAVQMTRSLLVKRPGWSFRTYGYIDCRGGRINRTHWRCRFAWTQGKRRCRIGRVQVFGVETKDNINYYEVHDKIYDCHASY